MTANDRPRRLFSRARPTVGEQPAGDGRPDGFAHVASDSIYLDSACQSLRPRPVIDAMTTYYEAYGACGGRVSYEWGRRVDGRVEATRRAVLDLFALPAKRYACAFTLNTTYGINLLLNQLPTGRFSRVITTHTEHNAVFVSTIAFAQRTGIPRIVVERDAHGTIDTSGADLSGALVVVSAMDNVSGVFTGNLAELVADVQRAGGAVIVDAAQAAPHAMARLRGIRADAVCFSAHKMYGPSLGVVVATNDLLLSLDATFVGGGQVASVHADRFELLAEPYTRLEPGLQAWGEIIAFGAALEWFTAREGRIRAEEERLAGRLFEGLRELPHLRVLGAAATPVISVVPERVDGHRLGVFLSKAGIMVRSGYFCAHHWLIEREGLDPAVRFSLGAHNDDADVDRALEVMGRLMKGL